MREIQASETKTHLPHLLDDVERGKPLSSPIWCAIARTVPEADVDRAMATPLVMASGGESLLSFISIPRRCFGAFARRAESLNPLRRPTAFGSARKRP
jgi:hypothetical protein